MFRSSRVRPRLRSLTAVVLALAGLAGCNETPKPGWEGDGATSWGDGDGGGQGVDGGRVLALPDGGGGDAGMLPEGTYPCLQGAEGSCAGQLYRGRALPLDIFIMFDQSGSLIASDDGDKTTRLDNIRDAVTTFLQAETSKGIGVGIGYFGNQSLLDIMMKPEVKTSCDPLDYAKAAVEIGTLPEHAPKMIASLKTIVPIAETPTGAAIRGACMYAKSRKQAEPTHNVVILLVTDGLPGGAATESKGGCVSTLPDAVAAATECTASGLKTYVLGVGPKLDNLNAIAAASGTGSAFLVQSGGAAAILTALNQIREDAQIPCALQVPTAGGKQVDYQTVNVRISDSGCKVTTFLNVREVGKCDPAAGGWYYDNPSQPGLINLCAASCEQTKAIGAQLVLSVGCMTRYVE
jgi:hypothetical protein